MKVGIYLPSLDPLTGGAFTLQDEILISLGQRVGDCSHELVLISWKVPAAAQQAGLPVLKIPGGVWGKVRHRLAGYLGRKSWVDNFLRDHGVECLLYPAPSVLTYDIPFGMVHWDIQHRNNPYFPEVSQGREWQQRENFYSVSLRRAAFLLTGTETGRREICGYYQLPESRVSVAPLPVPSYVLKCRKAGVLPGGLSEDDYFLYPAQFWPHKNHANLFLALAELKKQGVRARLVLVGSDKGNSAYLKRFAEKIGVADQVDFLGFVSREELVALYGQARALAFMSLCGPDNLPPLEAFALGCPVVASDIPGAKNQMEGAAILVNPLDPADIAAGMRKIMEDSGLREQLVSEGRRIAEAASGDRFATALFEALDRFSHTRRTWGI